MKSEPTLLLHSPHGQRTVYVAVARLQNAVGVVCIHCRIVF
jgi:hypothetical protein